MVKATPTATERGAVAGDRWESRINPTKEERRLAPSRKSGHLFETDPGPSGP